MTTATPTQPVEQRLATLELQMAELNRSVDEFNKANSWFDKVRGTFKDDPDFGEILRLGSEIRRAQRNPDES